MIRMYPLANPEQLQQQQQRRSSLEESLRQLCWRAGELKSQEIEEHLERIREFDGYLMLMDDGKAALSPDGEQQRVLPAVFTDEADCTVFAAIHGARGAPRRFNGTQLFDALCAMPIDGVIFNPATQDANRRLGFAAPFCSLVAKRTGRAPDFDRLVAGAFPAGRTGEIGDPADPDALWRELLSLEAWLFAVHPGNPAQPYLSIYRDRLCIFAFTDSARLETFCRENGLLGDKPDQQAHFLWIETAKAIGWLQGMERDHGLEVIHFNFGGVGWFAPIANLDPICRHLGYS